MTMIRLAIVLTLLPTVALAQTRTYLTRWVAR
jgi:hypothetical protein